MFERERRKNVERIGWIVWPLKNKSSGKTQQVLHQTQTLEDARQVCGAVGHTTADGRGTR